MEPGLKSRSERFHGYSLRSVGHFTCIFIIKSHLNTVIYSSIYVYYFFAYFTIMSLPSLNSYNNLLLREVVQSFRSSSNYFKRHKRPNSLSSHPITLTTLPLDLLLTPPYSWILCFSYIEKFTASQGRRGSFSLLSKSCSSLCRQLPPHLVPSTAYQLSRTTLDMAPLERSS